MPDSLGQRWIISGILVLCQTFTYIIVLHPPNSPIKYYYLHCPDEETKKWGKSLGPIHTTSNESGTRTWVLYVPKACLNYLTSLFSLFEKIHIQLHMGDAIGRLFSFPFLSFFLTKKQRTLKIVGFTIIEYNTTPLNWILCWVLDISVFVPSLKGKVIIWLWVCNESKCCVFHM